MKYPNIAKQGSNIFVFSLHLKIKQYYCLIIKSFAYLNTLEMFLLAISLCNRIKCIFYSLKLMQLEFSWFISVKLRMIKMNQIKLVHHYQYYKQYECKCHIWSHYPMLLLKIFKNISIFSKSMNIYSISKLYISLNFFSSTIHFSLLGP